MALQITLLQESFNQITPNGEAFVTSFYEHLFSTYPETQRLFANISMEEQHHKLLMSLVLIIENLNKSDYLASILKRLGAIHSTHKVQPEHFDMVGNILLQTFARFLKPMWTPDLEAAWAEAYQTLASMMLAGY